MGWETVLKKKDQTVIQNLIMFHHSTKNFKCPIPSCNKAYSTNKELRDHMQGRCADYEDATKMTTPDEIEH